MLQVLMVLIPLAFADSAIVRKINSSGYTPAQWVRTESCEVFRDKVVISKNFGASPAGVTLRQELPVSVGGEVDQIISNAKAEKEKHSPNMLCDGPSTTVETFDKKASILLFTTGGCGSDRVMREGPASGTLREIADQYCPKTYDTNAE
jgi:hypothetical protein